ncbi:hypothetical protein ACFFV7_24175 [Nonomuraea spiralis]|uniref:Uncharacterized protein n=1 Tax=Nonomuraea spiralis TaxID=46182 RepID=A0ABV5IIE9_9ACTN|nr:hypothetical protein [Nonomuraea spiralis]GGS96990.1 hypothetical protein GCM10010176_046150 [Nonomuraea spiralis]
MIELAASQSPFLACVDIGPHQQIPCHPVLTLVGGHDERELARGGLNSRRISANPQLMLGDDQADALLLRVIKVSPPMAACHASGGRWPRSGSPVGRGQHRPRMHDDVGGELTYKSADPEEGQPMT